MGPGGRRSGLFKMIEPKCDWQGKPTRVSHHWDGGGDRGWRSRASASTKPAAALVVSSSPKTYPDLSQEI